MLKSILVASDLSPRAQLAVQRAVQLAETSGARVTVLHVVEDDLPESRIKGEIASATAFLSDQIAGIGAPFRGEVVVITGHAFHAIGAQAQACEADLVVMGAHRRRFLRDVFTGTTVERVTRTAGRPVLMVNGKTAGNWRKVVIATDMSETSGHAARTARDLGLLSDAEVTFVHAHAPVARELMVHVGIAPGRVQQEAEREYQSKRDALGRFIQGLDFGAVNHRVRVIEGIGADAITGFVNQAKPDLLVIGTRGLSGVRRLVLGSMAQDLMGGLEIDILAVPPRA